MLNLLYFIRYALFVMLYLLFFICYALSAMIHLLLIYTLCCICCALSAMLYLLCYFVIGPGLTNGHKFIPPPRNGCVPGCWLHYSRKRIKLIMHGSFLIWWVWFMNLSEYTYWLVRLSNSFFPQGTNSNGNP